MRKLIVVMSFAILAIVALPSSARDAGPQHGCSATTGVSASPVTGGSPACTFSVVCEPSTCGYVARVDSNGFGSVAGRIEIHSVDVAFGNTTVGWRGFGGPDAPPSCTGTFSCTGPSNMTLLILEQVETLAIVTLRCSGGGVALVESISCTLAATQD